MTSPKAVNAALAAAGLKVEIVRSPAGYYYFIKDGLGIESIYSFNLRDHTTEEIVTHVREGLAIHRD